VETGERQLRLGFDTARDQNGPLARVVEEGRLADPGLATENEDAASGRARSVEQLADPSPLVVAAVEHLPIIWRVAYPGGVEDRSSGRRRNCGVSQRKAGELNP
jgi:hypothetical protein